MRSAMTILGMLLVLTGCVSEPRLPEQSETCDGGVCTIGRQPTYGEDDWSDFPLSPSPGPVTSAPADISEILGDKYDGLEWDPWGEVEQSSESDIEAVAVTRLFWTIVMDDVMNDETKVRELCEIGTEDLCLDVEECLKCVTAGASPLTDAVIIDRTITPHILWVRLPTDDGPATVYVFRDDDAEPWKVERWAFDEQ